MSSFWLWRGLALQNLIGLIKNSVRGSPILGLIQHDVIIVDKQAHDIAIGFRLIDGKPRDPKNCVLSLEDNELWRLSGQKSQPGIVQNLSLEAEFEGQLPASHDQITGLGISLEIIGCFQVAGPIVVLRDSARCDSEIEEYSNTKQRGYGDAVMEGFTPEPIGDDGENRGVIRDDENQVIPGLLQTHQEREGQGRQNQQNFHATPVPELRNNQSHDDGGEIQRQYDACKYHWKPEIQSVVRAITK